KPRTGGRGLISIELDDALYQHWSMLFPVTKELGIPMSSAWHTANGERWIKEAHRHGWEIMSHLPSNLNAVTLLADGTLDAYAQESLDAVRAITGAERVGFVYPAHNRSLETDRVLSKYYSFGRGLAESRATPANTPNPWLTTAFFLDTHFTGGGVAQAVKDLL